MELGLRARARGVPTVLHPSLRVRHTGGHAILRDGEPFALLARRRREAVASALGPRARALDDLAQLLTFATRIGARAALGRDADPRAGAIGGPAQGNRELAVTARASMSPRLSTWQQPGFW